MIEKSQVRHHELVEELKVFGIQERERIYTRHRFGIGGREIVEEHTRLADNVIQRIYQSGIQDGLLPDEPPAGILALGGYGREELNPYSDIDIMLVYDHRQVTAKQLEPFAARLVAALWDSGFEVGHSCRSIKESIRATYQDIFSKTSMLEARYVVGPRSVYRQFQNHTSKHFFKKRVGSFITQTIHEWTERHAAYGSTIYLQEPNIKESAGGLRDFHSGIWVAAVRYGIKELNELAKRRIIPQTVADACEDSLDFLWRLRNELHYLAKKRTDQLTFEVQEVIAKNLGYVDEGNRLAEESMMRDYYLHAEHLFEFARLIIDRVKENQSPLNQLMARWWSKKLPDDFVVMRNEICFLPNHSDLAMTPRRLMKVFVHRQRLGNRVGADIRHAIAENLNVITDEFRTSHYNANNFLAILRYPLRVAETLRRMHRWQVLDRYIPEFGTIRSLVKYDRPHEYTVDEHTMYALENLEEETLSQLKEGDIFRDMLNSVEKPELLRLAVLLHDVGKGIEGPGDHDERSVEAAKTVLERLGIEGDDRETVLFLVSYHLVMSHTARQRDLDDPKVIQRFSELVQNEQRLKMLYLLTFADIRAVSASIWTEWNAMLLWELYSRTLKYLEGKVARVRLDELRQQVCQCLGRDIDERLVDEHFEKMPERELSSDSPELISKQIQLIQQLGDAPITVSSFSEEHTYTQIGIAIRNVPGSFRCITGVLATQNINVLSAQVSTRSDGVVIDVINITDAETGNRTPADRRHQLAEMLTTVCNGTTDVEAALRKLQGPELPPHLQRLNVPSEIQIDNQGSDRETIIDIRTRDRVGLLFTISDTFYRLGLNLRLAKITTEAFVAIDSFYVTDQRGGKIVTPEQIESIKQTLHEALNRGERENVKRET